MWTLTVMPVYTVWEIARHGGRWVVPTGLMAAEYGLPCAVIALASSFAAAGGPRPERAHGRLSVVDGL